MKSTTSVLTLILGGASMLMLTSCQTVSTSNKQYIGVQQFAPTDPMQVEILRTEPSRSHLRIGEVRAEPSSENTDVTKIETALKKAAARMGANAAVVVYDKTQIVAAQVVGGWLDRSIDPVEGRIVMAVAIRYQ